MFLLKKRALAACAAILAGAAFFAPAANADYAMTRKDCQLAEAVSWKIIERMGAYQIDLSPLDRLVEYVDHRSRPARNRAVLGQISAFVRHFAYEIGSGKEVDEIKYACPKSFPLFGKVRTEGSRLTWDPVIGTTEYRVRAYHADEYGSVVEIATDTATGTYVEYAGRGINSGQYSFEVYALTDTPWGRIYPEDQSMVYSSYASVSGHLATDQDDGTIDWIRYGSGRITWDKSDLPGTYYTLTVSQGDTTLLEESGLTETGIDAPFIAELGGDYLARVTESIKEAQKEIKISLPKVPFVATVRDGKISIPFGSVDQVMIDFANGGANMDILGEGKDRYVNLRAFLEEYGLSGKQTAKLQLYWNNNGLLVAEATVTIDLPPAPPEE